MSDVAQRDQLEHLLGERAQRLAAVAQRSERREVRYQVALVCVGSQRLGVPAEHVREIVALAELTRVPSQPRLLSGLTQLRGELLGVVDTGALLDIKDAGDLRFAVVVDGAPGALVLGVERVEGFRPVYADEIVHGLAGPSQPVLTATRDFVSVLDVPAIFALDGIRVGDAPRGAAS